MTRCPAVATDVVSLLPEAWSYFLAACRTDNNAADEKKNAGILVSHPLWLYSWSCARALITYVPIEMLGLEQVISDNVEFHSLFPC